MSCLLKLFRKKQRPPASAKEIPIQNPLRSERFSVSLTLEGVLPDRDFELGLLENYLIKRISEIKVQSFRAYMNATIWYQKGDMRKYAAYMTERRYHSEKIRQIGKRLIEVQVKRLELQSPPYLELPPPVKIDEVGTYSMVQGHDVTNYLPPKMVNSCTLGRQSKNHANTLSSAPPHLRGRF